MKKYLCALIFLIGCGGGTEIVEVPPSNGGSGNVNRSPSPIPSPGGGGSGGGVSFNEARAIMGEFCERCHANAPWLQSETALRNSGVKNRTSNKSMPPNQNEMPDAARNRLLEFF
jgi:hypothetical protein